MNSVRIRTIAAVALSAVMLSITSAVAAEAHRGSHGAEVRGHDVGRPGFDHRRGERFHRPVPDFHGRAFAGFSPYERGLWGRGQWIHEWHGGRYGWWWVLGDAWYLYPEPIYPYPTYVPPAVVGLQAPPVPSGMPPAQSWYFCDNPQGYYPYVASCDGNWRAVPAAPPPASAAALAPAPSAAPSVQ